MFKKIWCFCEFSEDSFAWPKDPPKHVLEPLIYRQSLLKLLEGKQNNLNNLSKLLFVAFEGQCFIAILVQGNGQQCRTVVQQFWRFMASESGPSLEARLTWSTNALGLSSFCLDSLDSPFDQTFSNHLLFSIEVMFE